MIKKFKRSFSFFEFFKSVGLIVLLVLFCLRGLAEVSDNAVFVTFVLDDEVLAEVPTFPDEKDPLESEIVYDSFIDVITPILKSDYLNSWKGLVRQGRIRIKDLQGPLKAEFDLNKLEVKLSIPVKLRQSQGVYLGYKTRKNQRAKVIAPAPLSGYFNFFLSKPYSSVAQEVTPLNGTLESYVNANDVVLEDTRLYTEFSEHLWRRQGTRLVWDTPANLVRYSVGDLKYPVVGFQTATNMGGLSITKNYDLNPYINTTAQSRTSFVLDQPSTVEIYVNGQLVRTLDLKSGQYDVTDLPLTYGFNDVELVIKSKFGKVERLRFPYVQSSELLRKDLQKFTFNLGYSSTANQTDFDYDNGNPLFSGFHRLGLMDNLTAGLSLQTSSRQSLLGLESIWGASTGIISFDVGSSYVSDFSRDQAVRMRFKSWNDPAPGFRDWGFGTEHYGRRFASLGQTNPDNATASISDVFISPKFFQTFYTTFGASRRLVRSGTPNVDTYSFRGFKSLSPLSFLSTDVSYSEDTADNKEWKVGITFSWHDSGAGWHQNLSYEKFDNTKRYDIQKNWQRSTVGLAIEDRDSAEQGGVRGFYGGQRFNIGADYQAVRNKQTDIRHQSGDINFGTAYAWTSNGGSALMAPIYDSFAIFELGAGLEDKYVDVGHMGEKSEFSSDWMGNLPISSLASYRERPLYLDAGDHDGIIELNEHEFSLQPTYRSGLYKNLFLYSTSIVRGRIIDQAGNVVSLKYAEIQSLTSNSKSTFFTNRHGEFEIEHILGGTYQIVFLTSDLKSQKIVIPEGKNGFIELGDIVVGASDE